MDIVTIFLENGDVKKLGDYFSSGYRTPEEDETQDWKLESSKQVDSAVEVHFSRKVVTEDSEKVTFNLIALKTGLNFPSKT